MGDRALLHLRGVQEAVVEFTCKTELLNCPSRTSSELSANQKKFRGEGVGEGKAAVGTLLDERVDSSKSSCILKEASSHRAEALGVINSPADTILHVPKLLPEEILALLTDLAGVGVRGVLRGYTHGEGYALALLSHP